MADTREKLIELLKEADRKAYEVVESRQLTHPFEVWEIQADQLIAHGVTLDNQVSSIKCDYCQEDVEGYRKTFGAFSIVNPSHGHIWQIATPYRKSREIFFCPMCGRKLAEPPKGE